MAQGTICQQVSPRILGDRNPQLHSLKRHLCGNTRPESYHCYPAEKIGQEHLFKTCIERECSHVKWQNKSTQICLKAQTEHVLRFCLHSL